MKWMHISDLHFNPMQDGTDTNVLREKLKDFLSEKKVRVDKIFLTGDFRDASKQEDSDENAEKVVEYIREISKIVGIEDLQNILCVPGNHDLERNSGDRQKIICNTKRSYRPQDGIYDNMPTLVDAFTFYRRVLNRLYGQKYTDLLFDAYKANPHSIYQYSDCNILMLNTELFAGEMVQAGDGKQQENDAGTLIIGSNYVLSLLMNVKNTGKQTVVLGHRSLELIEAAERRKLLSIFQDNNVCLYLCGHSHELWFEEYGAIPQITVGCIREADGVKAGFTIGEIRPESNTISTTAYSWDNNYWNDYSHFSKKGSTINFDISKLVSITDFPHSIKIIIDGRVRVFNCRVPENGMTFGVEYSPVISVATGDLVCSIMKNQYSAAISFNQRFVLSKDVWKVIGVDNTANGITKLTCKRELKGHDDDFVSGIASKNLISNYEIKLKIPIDSIGLNQQLKFLPDLIRDMRLITDAKLSVIISDDDILTYDGINITGISLGETDVTVYWDDDKDIFGTFRIQVTSEPVTNTFYRVYKRDKITNGKSYYDFTVIIRDDVYFGIEKYVNCELNEVEEAFVFQIVKINDGTIIPTNNEGNCEVKVNTSCMNIGEKYLLKITGESTMLFEFKSRGLF